MQQIAVRNYLLTTAVYALITNATDGHYNAGAGVQRATYDGAFAFLGAYVIYNNIYFNKSIIIKKNNKMSLKTDASDLSNNGVDGGGLQNAPANFAAAIPPPIFLSSYKLISLKKYILINILK